MKCMLCTFAIAFCTLLADCSQAQNPNSYLNDTGGPAYGVQIPVENGFIDVSNGDLHLEFPFASPPQRGALSVTEKLVYDSRIWNFMPFGTHGSYHWWPYNVYSAGGTNTSGGWRFVTGGEIGSISQSYGSQYSTPCGSGGDGSEDPESLNGDPGGSGGPYDVQSSFTYIWTDPNGSVHPTSASYSTDNNECTGSYTAFFSPGVATDGSGYSVKDSGDGSPAVIDSNGNEVYPQIVDRYGNYLATDSNGNLMDDTGRVPVIVTQNGSTTYYDVLAPNGTINNNGTRVRYTVTTAPVPVSTNFQQSDTYEWVSPQHGETPLLTPVQSIQLPDGSQYTFAYDNYGMVSSVSLPTGGVVTYGHSNFVDSSNTSNRWLSFRQLGNQAAATFSPRVGTTCANYSSGCTEYVTHQKPSGDQSIYELTLVNGAWNTAAYQYTGAAPVANRRPTSVAPNLLAATIATNQYSNGCSGANCTGANYPTNTLQTTVLYNGTNTATYKQSQSAFDPTSGKPTYVKEWDYVSSQNSSSWSSPPSSTPTRETDYTYSGFDVSNVKVLGPDGSQAGNTTYSYTGNPGSNVGVPQHGPQNYGGPYLQSVAHWLNTNPSNPSTTTYVQDDSGMVTSIRDPNGNPTTFTYQCANSLPFQTHNALQQVSQRSYDCSSGALVGVQDPNDLAASRSGTTYSYEQAVGRVQTISRPDGGSTTYSYPSTTEVDTTVAGSPNPNITSSAIADAFGRPYAQVAGGFETDTTYDAGGRVSCTTLPYASGGSPSGSTCVTQYDGLDRPLKESLPDGSSSKTWSYNGQWTALTDERGNTWQQATNAFGKLIAVYEPGIQGMTSYQYDALGNISYIYQPGNPNETVRAPRIFAYDSLSRLVCKSQPESSTNRCSGATSRQPAGTLTYQYDAAGNVNQRTDARGAVTNYFYDALNRLTAKTYPTSNPGASTPNVSYNYDESGDWGYQNCSGSGVFTQCNTIGRLSSAYTANGYLTGNAFGYDAMGRLHLKGSCTGIPQCGHDANSEWYFYDLAGNPQNQDFGNNGQGYFGGQWMTYDNAGRLSTQGYFAQPLPYPITPEFTAGQYGPGGLVTSTVGNNQLLIQTRSYDSSLRPSGYSIGPSSNPGAYGWSVGYQPNGILSSSSDTFNGSWNYTSDALNRLTAASSPAVGLQWTYDSFGNQLSQTITSGTGTSHSASYTQTGTNRPDALLGSIDAAGNLSSDGSATPVPLTWDAEGRLSTAGSTSYLYNPLGERVAKYQNGSPYTGTLSSVYLYDQQGHVVTELNGGYSVFRKEVYADGVHLASYDAADTVTYAGSDWLGTERAKFDTGGALCQGFTSQPFGDNLQQRGGCGVSPLFFTGLERDNEANSDHTPNRQYSFQAGRWLSPDPYNGSMDLSNPQSLNRYSYVGNLVLNGTDPSGLSFCGIGGFGSAESAGAAAGGIVGGAITAAPYVALAACAAFAIDEIFHLFDHPKFTASHTPRPNATPWDEHGSYQVKPFGGIGDILGVQSNECEFGACGAGPSSFQAGAVALPAAGGAVACAAAEPCGAIAVGAGVLVGVGVAYENKEAIKGSWTAFADDFLKNYNNLKNENNDRCAVVKQAAIASCSAQFVGRGLSESPVLTRACVRIKMTAEGCFNY